eukprot:CAMPEP_0170556722 /NCGR_PEP_ID=MMETSP0211-20121228/18303_1 /TAXON_ID=311385 /ORGANISM="Pseudokeronopsis sp., Strain OXSARD2" /LENGTH=156 /DNA_ID=CAMNT_0010867227 /DNA_START=399 /DNA_END=869 /DNA_ORIENTATION=+
MRAFYHLLQGVATQSQNDWLLGIGLISVFTLPAIGYFDEHAYSTLHGIIAGLFFISVGVYSWMLSSIMSKNKDAFPEEIWPIIDRMKTVKNLMWICLLCFLLAMIFGNDWMTPLMEWLSTLLFLNYFVLVSGFDNYYDAVLTPESDTMQRAIAAKV